MIPRIRLGAIAWILTLQFFIVETLAGGAWPGYSFVADRISDLGAARSPWHAIVDATLVIQGLLIAGGALLVREVFPAGRARSLGIGLIVVNGAGAALVGLVPEDANRALHDVGAMAIFLSGNLGMLALGTAILGSARMRALGANAIVLGVLGIVGSILFVVRPIPGLLGLFEHLAVDTLPLWLLSVGLFLLLRRTSAA